MIKYKFDLASYVKRVKGSLTLYCKGILIYRNNVLNPDEVFQQLIKHDNNYKEFLQCLYGHWSIVFCSGDSVYVFTDHVRTYPLYYTYSSVSFEISEATHIFKSNKLNEIACQIYKLTGFTLGNETLIDSLYQTKANLLIRFHSGLLSSSTYRRFSYSPKSITPGKEFYYQLDKILDHCFERLKAYSGIRQVVCPLSGGYDSRLILLQLIKNRFPNIICYTYGTKNDKEVEIAKRLSSALNIKIHVIEYDISSWTEIIRERKIYELKSHQYSVQPHVQDFLAVYTLNQNNLVNKDAIFVPGHSGDFIAGSHLGEEFFQDKILNNYQLKNLIWKKHFDLDHKHSKNVKAYVFKRIFKFCDSYKSDSNKKAGELFEKFDFDERQVKFIVKSVSVYSNFGYDYWLPLWDPEFVNACLKVEFSFKRNRIWYINYINNHFIPKYFKGWDIPKSNPNDLNPKFVATRKILEKLHLLYVFRRLIKSVQFLLKPERFYESGHFACVGCGTKFILKLILKGYESTGIYNKHILSSCIESTNEKQGDA